MGMFLNSIVPHEGFKDIANTGRILAVGIGYQKKTKEHSCMVEILT